MGKKKKKYKYVSVPEAAIVLDVSQDTVRSWIKRGKFAGATSLKKAPKGAKYPYIRKDALKSAFKVECLWCGRIFRALHPEQARYCCQEHKDRYLYSCKRSSEKIYRPHDTKDRRQYRRMKKPSQVTYSFRKS